jgi:hypothetical protein
MKYLAIVAVLGVAGLAAAPVVCAQTSRVAAAAMTDAAIAAEAEAEAEKILDVPVYLAARERQLQEAEAGGYGKIPRPDMDRLRTAHATTARLLAGHQTATELGLRQKIELFNAQEAMTTILEHQSQTALICERVKPTGSHMRVNRCHTRAEREARRMTEQDGMRTNHMTPPCVGSNC